MNELTTIVSTVGFPIAMCGVLAWYVKYLTDGFKATIDNNTKLLGEIKILLMSSRLDSKGDEEKENED